MKVSVIIVNFNVKYFLEVCLDSVTRALTETSGEIIVVDNNSEDGSQEMIREKFPDITLIANKENRGFGRANNQAVAIAKGEYILFLNPDTVLPEDFFSQTLAYMDTHPEAGGIGPRLIDGKGRFAPDAKKSFPSLSVALFKGTGINKLFPRSPYFNKYYAVHIGEHETAAVDALSGCCMMMRKEAIDKAGGAFDEDYFMYFEDGDLCYRIRKAGYQNIYYPGTTVMHYKGESTRKTTLSYVRIFNEAFAIFARKHYKKQYARIFLLFINLGVVLRAVVSALKTVLKILKMPLFDAIILLLTLWVIKEFWTEQVKNIAPIPLHSIYLTFPAYLLIWILSLFLNGAYDQPYRGVRVVRGMAIGTIFCLAYFGLISPELRYSRAIIIITGVIGSLVLLALHELLYRLGIIRLKGEESLTRKSVIVADEAPYRKTLQTLERVPYRPDVYGRVAAGDLRNDRQVLAGLGDIRPLLYTAGIDEVIFCVDGIGYKDIMTHMERCGPAYEYKIHIPGTASFIGSNSSHTAGDLYTAERRFSLSQFANQRNKRVLDLAVAFLLLVLSPVAIFLVRHPVQFLRNCLSVLLAKNSWVGYAPVAEPQPGLPVIRPAILPPYHLLDAFDPGEAVKQQLNIAYAEKYNASQDLSLIFHNFRFLGRKSQKDFAEKNW